MLRLATIRDFRVNASAVLRQVERGGRVLVTRNARPIAVVSPVAEVVDLEDFILSSHPHFLKLYRKARKSSGIGLAQLKKQLYGRVPRRAKGTRPTANPKA